MITYEFMIIGLLAYLAIHSVLLILCGAIGADKPDKFGLASVADGISGLIVVIICILL